MHASKLQRRQRQTAKREKKEKEETTHRGETGSPPAAAAAAAGSGDDGRTFGNATVPSSSLRTQARKQTAREETSQKTVVESGDLQC